MFPSHNLTAVVKVTGLTTQQLNLYFIASLIETVGVAGMDGWLTSYRFLVEGTYYNDSIYFIVRSFTEQGMDTIRSDFAQGRVFLDRWEITSNSTIASFELGEPFEITAHSPQTAYSESHFQTNCDANW